MNEQLKRIREKDFSKIDETLFENLSKADNISSTLSHLSDFQRFLMEQINHLSMPQTVAKPSFITKSIVKNFDNLKESLVKCSRLRQKAEKSKLIGLKNSVKALKQQLQQSKKQIKIEGKQAINHLNKSISPLLNQMVSKYEQEKAKNQQLSIRCNTLQSQNSSYQAKIQQLNKTVKYLSQKVISTRHADNITILPVHTSPSLQANAKTPLRQANEPVNSMQHSNKDVGWKDIRNKMKSGFTDKKEKQMTPLKRQTSNHELARKETPNSLIEKQNRYKESDNQKCYLLKRLLNGQELARGKSKQKIKLFSMF